MFACVHTGVGAGAVGSDYFGEDGTHPVSLYRATPREKIEIFLIIFAFTA